MTYAVKTLYPEFKCLTTFRKVMKRIETAKGDWWKLMKPLRNPYERNIEINKTKKGFWDRFDNRENMLYSEYLQKLIDDDREEGNRLYMEMRITHHNILSDYDENYEEFMGRLGAKFPMFYKIGANGKWRSWFDERLPQKWLWAEQNKVDMMAKKWEFQQAMISRDYKTTTLCDDVIGLVFEYL